MKAPGSKINCVPLPPMTCPPDAASMVKTCVALAILLAKRVWNEVPFDAGGGTATFSGLSFLQLNVVAIAKAMIRNVLEVLIF